MAVEEGLSNFVEPIGPELPNILTQTSITCAQADDRYVQPGVINSLAYSVKVPKSVEFVRHRHSLIAAGQPPGVRRRWKHASFTETIWLTEESHRKWQGID